MGRRAAVMVVGSLVLALAACGGGGGGGDEEAFCDALERLSDSIADGDFADDNFSDAVDTGEALRESASDDQEDLAVEISEIIQEADAEDPNAAAGDIQDAAEDAAEDCEIDEFAEAPEEETTTTTEPEEETTTTDPEEETTTTAGGGAPTGETNTLGALQPVPADIEPEFASLANDCFVGNVAACDDIFFGVGDDNTGAAPEGSVARTYAASCAGRIAAFVEGQPQECIGNFFLATEPDVASFTDPSFDGLAQACFANDMASCDQLFLQTAVDSAEELYGETCGFRLDPTITGTAPGGCTTIFGATAFG